jgi:hypothetical protein
MDKAAPFVALHEMAARRRCGEGEEERSVCGGTGAHSRGCDLCSVRTAVRRMADFIKT